MAKALLARKMVPTKMASNLMVRRKGIADSGLKKANVPEVTLVLGPSRTRRPKLGPEPEARAIKRGKGKGKDGRNKSPDRQPSGDRGRSRTRATSPDGEKARNLTQWQRGSLALLSVYEG